MTGTLVADPSVALFARAEQSFPGGVNSPVRSFRAVGGTPRFIARGSGAVIIDEAGRRYLDYVLSWGAILLGHSAPPVVTAIRKQARFGTSFGAPTGLEIELAERIKDAMPAIELLRFTSSGTEAVMSAVRLARAATGRPAILVFAGGYHGHADALLAAKGSGMAGLAVPASAGVPAPVVGETLVARYNDLADVANIVETHGSRLAAIIVEPVAGNMGLVLPRPGFLAGLRRIADRAGALLVFDEVMTGFRVGLGGAQERWDVRPDLTTLGKVIGGGLAVGAFGGRRELMEMIAPSGPVYQAGTLSGNPLAMAAGIAVLDRLVDPTLWQGLEATTTRLAEGLAAIGRETGLPIDARSAGAMWGFSFSREPVVDFDTANQARRDRFARFFHAMLRRGVYLPPSPFEACFVSARHDDRVVTRTLAAARRAAADVAARESQTHSRDGTE